MKYEVNKAEEYCNAAECREQISSELGTNQINIVVLSFHSLLLIS